MGVIVYLIAGSIVRKQTRKLKPLKRTKCDYSYTLSRYVNILTKFQATRISKFTAEETMEAGCGISIRATAHSHAAENL